MKIPKLFQFLGNSKTCHICQKKATKKIINNIHICRACHKETTSIKCAICNKQTNRRKINWVRRHPQTTIAVPICPRRHKKNYKTI